MRAEELRKKARATLRRLGLAGADLKLGAVLVGAESMYPVPGIVTAREILKDADSAGGVSELRTLAECYALGKGLNHGWHCGYKCGKGAK